MMRKPIVEDEPTIEDQTTEDTVNEIPMMEDTPKSENPILEDNSEVTF